MKTHAKLSTKYFENPSNQMTMKRPAPVDNDPLESPKPTIRKAKISTKPKMDNGPINSPASPALILQANHTLNDGSMKYLAL